MGIKDLIKPHIVRLAVAISNAIKLNKYNEDKKEEEKIDLWEKSSEIKRLFGYVPFTNIFESIHAVKSGEYFAENTGKQKRESVCGYITNIAKTGDNITISYNYYKTNDPNNPFQNPLLNNDTTTVFL